MRIPPKACSRPPFATTIRWCTSATADSVARRWRCRRKRMRCRVARDIAAVVADRGVGYLDGPIKTVTGAHTPVPFAGVLEAAFVPNAERVVSAALASLRD